MDADASNPRELIGERVEPDPGSFGAARAARGEPAWPRRFAWRGRTYEIAAVERAWKTTDSAHRPVGDAYVRRHWIDVCTTEGERMRLYADRGTPRGARGSRWWLHSRLR